MKTTGFIQVAMLTITLVVAFLQTSKRLQEQQKMIFGLGTGGQTLQVTTNDINPNWAAANYAIDVRHPTGRMRLRNETSQAHVPEGEDPPIAGLDIDTNSNTFETKIAFCTGGVERSVIRQQTSNTNLEFRKIQLGGATGGFTFISAAWGVELETLYNRYDKTVISTFASGDTESTTRVTVNADSVSTNVDDNIEFGCSDPTQEASPKVWFKGYVKDGVNDSDKPTTVRHGYMQGYLAPEAVSKGQFQSNIGIWTQLGSSPYNRTSADLEITYDGNVVINNGQIQTNEITSKDAASYVPAQGNPGDENYVPGSTGDAKIVFGDGTGKDRIVFKAGDDTPVMDIMGDRRQARIRSIGTEAQPALSFVYTTTGFFLYPDENGTGPDAYADNNSGIALTQNPPNGNGLPRSTVKFGRNGVTEFLTRIETPKVASNADDSACIHFVSTQAKLVAKLGQDEYVPTDDNSLVTRKYVDDKLENGATQITLPPNTDPATAEPLAIITLVSNQAAYIGAGKIAGYLDPDQVPTRATGAVWQFREDGTSDWFLGTASYIAYPGSTIGGTEKDMGDLQAAVTEAQAMTAEFASNARVKVLLNFGPTNGKSYEVRLAYETAAGVGAWEYDDGRFNPSGY
jgi:hypothetical protein